MFACSFLRLYRRITRTVIIILSVLGALLAVGMVALIAFCVIRGDTSRQSYDPIR